MSTNEKAASLLHVSEQAWGEVSPTAAYLHVILTSDKLFSGRAALEKAEELRRLAATLTAKGLSDDALSLEGVSLDTSSGLFGKSSSVTYRVRVHVREVDRLGDVLDAVADSKKATLTHITWDYSGKSSGASELLGDCAARAMGKAKSLAQALGVAIEAVHSVREEEIGEVTAPLPQGMLGGAPHVAMRARSSIATEMGGLDLAPKKKVGVRVILECRIASS